jgi:hypothetical protein
MRRKKAESVQLTELRARVSEWRARAGGRGSRIPEDLWQEAIRVARVEGLYATAQATSFSYERLKERSEKAQGSVESSRFVAVQLSPSRPGQQTTIELVGRRGGRMRVEVTGDVDVASVLETFWRRAS